MSALSAAYSFENPLHTEWESAYFDLRWQVLRAPWQQPKGSERDELEHECRHAMIVFDHKLAVACGRVQLNDADTAQVRYMAVHPSHQGKGLGSAVLRRLENEAVQWGARHVVLQARENAVPFYLANGYRVIEKTFILFGLIPHYLMKKEL